jgi:hypothetical protein
VVAPVFLFQPKELTVKTDTRLPIRQGDVLLIPVAAIPKDAAEQPAKGGKIVLAYGEVTGHHHRFEFRDTSHNVKLYVAHGGARYLHVTAPAELLHEEHDTARVPVGRYLIPQQVEYTPAELRNVQD